MKKLILLMLSFCAITTFAQTNKEYEEFLKNRNTAYEQYKKSVNEQFAKFIEDSWTEFKAMTGTPQPVKPKPVVMPNADEVPPSKPVEIQIEKTIDPVIDNKIEKKPDGKTDKINKDHNAESTTKEKTVPIVTPKVDPTITPKTDPTVVPKVDPTVKQNIEPIITPKVEPTVTPKITEKPETEKKETPRPVSFNTMSIPFYKTRLEIPQVQLAQLKLKDIKEKSVSEFWNELDKQNLEDVVQQLMEIKSNMNLNDWGFFTLCKETVNKIFTGYTPSEKTVSGVFLLNQCGYEIKVGRFENRLIYLIPMMQQVFKIPYITLDGNRYYILEHDGKSGQRYPSVFTYNVNFDKNATKFNLNINNAINFGNDLKTKSTTLNDSKINVSYNGNIIDFYKDYPRTELRVYFNASVDKLLSASIKKQLVPLLKGKTELESVNLLLKYMYDNFKYKTDEDQFGYERWFFAEENFYYPYGDCEDRSILFSWLVRELLNLDVVLLDYPQHIATAVRFNENVTGDYITVDGKKYIICDPTFFNAKAGMCMPQYKGQKPKMVR